jgi:hypothetical protein
MGLLEKFQADPQARRYADVLRSEVVRRAMYEVVEFFDSPNTLRRMIESEQHHDRPAIAGVVKDLDALIVKQIIEAAQHGDLEGDTLTATRRNQVIGVIVRIVMESNGWHPIGKKGSLAGLSDFFKRGERYAPKSDGT